MERLRAQHLNTDLCTIFQGEIKVMSQEIEALQLENRQLKSKNSALISAERKNQEATRLENQELKNKLQEIEANKVACPFTVEELLQQLREEKGRHKTEKQMLLVELTMATEELEDLNQQLKTEQSSRMQAETQKLEAVDIADTLILKLEELQKVSEAESQLLSAELKSEKSQKDLLHYEILELHQVLQQEMDSRDRAETATLNNFEREEVICEEFNQELHKEKNLREEAERSKMVGINIARALYQRLEEAKMLTDELSVKSQLLTERLKEQEKKHVTLTEDIAKLTRTLDVEMALRIQSEELELEAIEVIEALQKKIQKLRKRCSATTRSSSGKSSVSFRS